MPQITSAVDVVNDSFRDGPFGLPWSDGIETVERFQSLRRLVESTADRIWRFADLNPHVHELEEMIFELDDNGVMAQMFLASLSSSLVSLQQVAYRHWETELERRFVQNLNSAATIDDYPLAARFRRLIRREAELLSAAGCPRRLLFIGSGPVPISAILAHEYLGVNVDCVDADAIAVTHSRRLLQELGLSEVVRVIHADAAGFDASCYDAVLVALLAKPKNEILEAIAASARKDCRVVCRTSAGLRVLVYEPMRLGRDLRLHQVCDKRSAAGHGDTISSLLLALQ